MGNSEQCYNKTDTHNRFELKYTNEERSKDKNERKG